MESTSPLRLLRRLSLLLHRLSLLLLSLLPSPPFTRRRLSLVALKDLHLSLLLLLSGLHPLTLNLSADDTSLRIWAPRRRRTRKLAILLIHGFGGNSRWQFHRQIGPLSRSFDLYIPDLVFFGESISSGADRSVAFQSRCIAAAMRDLGVERYSVAGISYGGFVAFRMAAVEAAAEVEKVVVMTAGICATAEERRELAEKEGRDVAEILLPLRPEDLMVLMRRSMYRPPSWMPAFLLRDFVELMYKDHRKERVELLRKLLSNGVDLNPLPVVNKKTLVIWGDKDTVFPMSHAHRLLRHLGHNARLEVINEVGHALQMENPKLVNQLIKDFLMESKY